MTQISPTDADKPKRLSWLLLIPLLLGIIAAAFIPRPIVGVIYLDAAIDSYSAQDMIEQITYASEHPRVRAVVLVMNSPGGTVTDTESVYMELAKLRETKPVVTMIEGMAASGGYYLSVGTDYILAKPSSMVGNIGVIGYTPEAPSVGDDVYSTGPYKLFGFPRDNFIRQLEMLKQGFLQAVLLGRGDALKVGPEVVVSGQIWHGAEALRLGFVDGLATRGEAFDKAAELAHIANYKVEDLRPLAGLPESSYYYFFYETPEGKVTPYPREQGIYMLYIPPVGMETAQ